jgi:hypothetical protein
MPSRSNSSAVAWFISPACPGRRFLGEIFDRLGFSGLAMLNCPELPQSKPVPTAKRQLELSSVEYQPRLGGKAGTFCASADFVSARRQRATSVG